MQRHEFILQLAGVPVAVHYRPGYFRDYDHFEFRSTADPVQGIPISCTGYRSHFEHSKIVAESGGAEDYALSWCKAILYGKRAWDHRQLELF